MAITVQDMIRFGLVQDPKAYLESETKKWNDYYNEQIASQRQRIETASSDEMYNRAYERLDQIVERREQQVSRINQRYEDLLKKQDAALESPVLMTVARQRLETELNQQREQMRKEQAAIAEQQRREREGMQREQAERESGRSRARRAGGGRITGRPLLSAARMAPEQTMAPQQTLGAFMAK